MILADQDLVAAVLAQQTKIWWFLRSLGCDPSTADDLTQETCLATLRSESVPEIEDLFGYMRRVARNRFIDQLRRQGRVLPWSSEEVEELWARHHVGDDDEELRQALHACLAALDARTRFCVEQRYGAGEGREFLARELGLGALGITKLLQRAKRRLRLCIEERMRA